MEILRFIGMWLLVDALFVLLMVRRAYMCGRMGTNAMHDGHGMRLTRDDARECVGMRDDAPHWCDAPKKGKKVLPRGG